MKQERLKGLVEDLNQEELSQINGGFRLLSIFGLGDGVKGNTEVYLFGIRIYHGSNAPSSPR